MWVKICGTTNAGDALMAVSAGADAVGFVFAKSRRQIRPESAPDITRVLPTNVERVGVFTTHDASEIGRVIACSGLSAVQLHIPFDSAMVRALSGEFGGKLKIIQVVTYDVNAGNRPAADERFETELRQASNDPGVWAILLDTATGNVTGGTGVPFDWSHAATGVGRVLPKGSGTRLIIAGGLHPENVGEAIAKFHPWGVDVVSGVEAQAGVKDQARVKAFIVAAHS